MIRVLHTSDWHLGHTLHGLDRRREHAAFLAWLLDRLESESVDALLITGDVYDSACPPVAAERALFDFLASARERRPHLDVVIVGGNHDSAQRLEAPAVLLRPLGVHVVGGLPRDDERALDLERLLVPLRDAEGAVQAWVAAVPFLRPVDLPRGAELSEGVRAIFAEVLAEARARCEPDQALLATAHCTIGGSLLSKESERAIYGGDALPLDLFPEDVAYTALGHLHCAQAVGGREAVRYAGSPIPLSFAEVGYEHEVRLLSFEGARLVEQRGLAVPRSVELIRLPASGPAPLEEVLEALSALDERVPGEPTDARPFLDVRVQVEGAAPGLRRQIEEALADKRPRLVKLEVKRERVGESLADQTQGAQLGELDPREVFRLCYARAHEDEAPPRELSAAFESLLIELAPDEVRAETGVDAASRPAASLTDEVAAALAERRAAERSGEPAA